MATQSHPSTRRGQYTEWLGRAFSALGIYAVIGFVISAVVLFAFSSLADEVTEGDTLRLDNAVYQAVHQFASPALDALANVFSFMGAEGLGILTVLALLVLLVTRRWGSGILLIFGIVGAQVLNSLLKVFFHRERPTDLVTSLPGQVFSFPSGHAMVSLVAYGLLAALIWRHLDWEHKGIWVALLVAVVTIIGLSRIYLHVHYFTDVIAGYLAGTVWLNTLLVGSRAISRWRGKAVKPTEAEQHPETAQ